VLTAGTVLRAPQIGLAAAVGLPALPVRRRPVVLVLSTGSELVRRAASSPPGRSTSRTAHARRRVEEAGGRAELLRFVPDDVGQFLGRLRERIGAVEGGVDLVLTSGGVSAGRLRGRQGRLHRSRGRLRQGWRCSPAGRRAPAGSTSSAASRW
jgi:molybdopterin molybdotransferase